MVKKTIKLGMLVFVGTISACSTVKDMTNVDLWPFGKGGDQGREYQPANSTPYICEGNKKFFVRYLEKGASVWLILPDREVALAQVGSSKVYSNGISKLDLSSDDVSLEVNETTKYVGCKSNSAASVAKVTPKVVEKPAEKAPEPAPVVPAKEEPVAKVAEVAKPAEPVKVEPAPEPVAAAKAEKEEVAVEEAAPQGDAQVAVAKAVETWANAWRTKNADAYLNAYSAKFKPEGMSKAAWVQQRKQRVGANPAEITLTLDKLSIAADAKKATATFAQHYASGKYSDDVVKVLSFENVNGQWLIVKESAKAASAK
jgi:hypothetical protein